MCIGWALRLGVGFFGCGRCRLLVWFVGVVFGDLCMYARFAKMFSLVSAREVIENLRRTR